MNRQANSGRGGTTPIEYLFLERAIRLLAPGGRLAIIMPEGLMSRTGEHVQAVRDYLLRDTRLVGVVTIPRPVWRTSNSRFETNASIVLAQKKRRRFTQTAPAMLVTVEYVNVADPRGEDDLETLLPDVRAGFYDQG